MNPEDKDLDIAAGPTQQMDHSQHEYAVGQWFWKTVEDPKRAHPITPGRRLFCCVGLGSNHLKLESPDRWTTRVHLSKVDEELTLEPDPEKYIRAYYTHEKDKMTGAIQEIRDLSQRLGVSPSLQISGSPGVSPEGSKALAVLSSEPDLKGYEDALEKAKKETFPALYDKVRSAADNMKTWLSGQSLGLAAQAGELQDVVKTINSRIFNLELYAGLTERVAQVREGEPAGMTERLRVMQRRLYMDEECLLDYEHGGMEFHNIGEFDQWLAKPKNLDRVLPFPRCMVAFQVRRHQKDRDFDGSLSSALLIMDLRDLDALTFLYIRNGDQLWRMNCKMDFGTKIFPDAQEFDPGQPQMLSRDGKKFMTRGAWEEWDREITAANVGLAKWFVDNPFPQWREAELAKRKDPKYPFADESHWKGAAPYELRNKSQRLGSFNEGWDDFSPFDQSHLYYDEGIAQIKDKMDEYNRIALIIQGLLDRSLALHPHPPYQTWRPEGFAAAIELIYDADRVLTYRETPDFEKYRARVNASLKVGSMVVGQQKAWLARGAARLYAREKGQYWRKGEVYQRSEYAPEGDPGPGHLVEVKTLRGKSVKFDWLRESKRQDDWGRGPRKMTPDTITVPISSLFNVSGYRLGDYLQFFQDPRTRGSYLKWAPMLLAAEEYWAGTYDAKKHRPRTSWA